jgi:hypothetical protein
MRTPTHAHLRERVVHERGVGAAGPAHAAVVAVPRERHPQALHELAGQEVQPVRRAVPPRPPLRRQARVQLAPQELRDATRGAQSIQSRRVLCEPQHCLPWGAGGGASPTGDFGALKGLLRTRVLRRSLALRTRVVVSHLT